MTPAQTQDFELIKQMLVFTTRINERGWVVLRTEYNGRWLESILMGDDKHDKHAQEKSMHTAALTIWMEERMQCPACKKFQNVHVVGKCEYCNHEFVVWLEDDSI